MNAIDEIIITMGENMSRHDHGLLNDDEYHKRILDAVLQIEKALVKDDPKPPSRMTSHRK